VSVFDDDDVLFEELREAVVAADPVPALVIEGARLAYGWRRIDAELAELLHDSNLEAEPLAGVRGAAAVRSLTFRVGDLTIEVDVAPDGDARHLNGQLVPPQAAVVHLRHEGGELEAAADELGRFELHHVPPGLVSLRVLPLGAATACETEWVVI
jgi:hypothetical protein